MAKQAMSIHYKLDSDVQGDKFAETIDSSTE